MLKFSANIGFLWTDRPHVERIHAASKAGFDAVECHFPYDEPEADIRAALQETGLPMVGLNTSPGDAAKGEFGLAAMPGREPDARDAIDQAIAYAEDIGAARAWPGWRMTLFWKIFPMPAASLRRMASTS